MDIFLLVPIGCGWLLRFPLKAFGWMENMAQTNWFNATDAPELATMVEILPTCNTHHFGVGKHPSALLPETGF
jgi:hypothetical protein